jgi:myo-inositol-1-phosphate synthase
VTSNDEGLGLWFIGARGSVATTATIGAAAVSSHAAAPTGMVTEHPALESVALPPVERIVIGGHDVAATPLRKRAEQLAADGVVPTSVLATVADRLDEAELEIRTAPDASTTPADAIAQVRDDLRDFRERHDLDRIVVINLASTEPLPHWPAAPRDRSELDQVVDGGWASCPVSVTYAVAAIEAGCGYVDFTPAAATATPAIVDLARHHGVPLAGRDGKTGETLLKTVLAPMFSDRALKVLSWAGTNLLGGGDGATLADPDFANSKIESKARVLGQVLEDDVVSPVHIDHVPDLGEWKTAWNHIHFEGFLGTRMTLQFTWQGCDSTLAAPLVIDLARLTGMAMARGESGPLDPLAFFFKDPISGDEHRLAQQFDALCAWAAGA